MKIGVFGGSFDPPHHGHIALVCSIIEKLSLDCVYIIPSRLNPLKPSTMTPPEVGLNLVQLAFQDVPKTQVLDCELNRQGSSYTIDTVMWLIEHDPEFQKAERFLLIGDDLLSEIDLWKEPEKLFQQIHPVVAVREGKETTQFDVLHLDTPRFDISSTEIRERVKKGLYCGHLAPQPVLSLIHQLKLYKGK